MSDSSRCTYLIFGEPECNNPPAGRAQVWVPSGKRSFCAEHLATIQKVGDTRQQAQELVEHLEHRLAGVKGKWPLIETTSYTFWSGYEHAIRDLKAHIEGIDR